MNSICKRIVAIVAMVVFAIGLTTCKKEKIEVPTVKVFEGAITINYTKASVSAEVTNQGSAEVKSRGFAYSTTGGILDTIFCGSGTGVFSADLTNLEPNTTYVYEAFAKNAGGFGTSGKVTFTTKENTKPTVKTAEVKNEDVTTTTAKICGTVMDDGGVQVTERGVCWSTSHNPTLNDSHLPAGGDLGEFTCDLTNLSANTKYYVCAYAKNIKGPAYGEEKNFTTKPLQTYTISVVANPDNGGTVTGGGTFNEGQSCTIKATDNTGYNFVKWTENDEQVSTDREYTFNVMGNRDLVAHFSGQPCTIIATPEPEDGGMVSGTGGYNYGDHCTLAATAKPGFDFSKWTENDIQVSTDATYSFDVMGNRNLKAHFTLETYRITAIAEPSEGGTASVSGSGQFHFGEQCILTATPNSGYNFVNWTKNGIQVSPQAICSIEVTESAEYVAHFQLNVLNLTVSANPTVIARGNSSQLNAAVSGGNGNFTYNWSPSTGLNNTHIQNPTATPSTTKTYTCTVTSGSQTKSESCVVTVVCPPTNLSATVQNGNHVYLSWTTANPATKYKVYRGNTLIQSNVTTTHFTDDSNLSPGTYTYQVSTVYSNVESPKSEPKEVSIAAGDQTFTVNGVSFTMKRVEGGTFWMGAQSTNSSGQNYDNEADSDESPVHSVTLNTFYMGETEVTQALWQAVMGSNPSYFSGTTRPVEQVSWNTIVNQFIPALNALTGRTFRLPTEAEWEYAARGGNQGHGYKYAGSNMIGNVAWYYDNSNGQTHPVGTKSPNELGLYDMSGNVCEWCSDWYGNYSSGSQTNPQGPSSGSDRVLRGGRWNGFARYCRVSYRIYGVPGFTFNGYGFRLVLSQ